MCGFFDLRYKGRDLADIIAHRDHGIFRDAGAFAHNALMDEIETAQSWGGMRLEDYWLETRADRQLMVGLVKGQRVMRAIAEHDRAEQLRRDARRRNRGRGKK